MRPSLTLIILAIALVGLTGIVAISGIEGTALVIALWVAVGVGTLFDLMTTVGKRAVRVTVDWPDFVFVGTSEHVPITVHAKRLPRALQVQIETGDGLEVRADPLRATEGGAIGELTISCRKRGEFAIAALWLTWPSRLGFFEVVARHRPDVTVKGTPNIQPILTGEIATQINAELYGTKSTSIRGEGSDFHQLREFTSGMDTRMIDWKRSARHQTLVARETHAEQNHQVILCVDNGYLMREEIAGLPKIDHAINAALALAWAAGIGGDLAGFYTYDSRPKTFLPPQPGRQAFNRIKSETAALKYSQVETNHTLAMAHLNGLLNRRSLIVVFSDFVDSITAELLVENIGVLSRHHVLVFVTLRDPILESYQAPEELTLDNIARAVSATQISQERVKVFDTLRRLGVMCIDVAPERLTPELLSTYLEIKAREII